MASGNDATKCPLCTKSVYRVEEILCAGQSWHKTCFKCGGIGEDGCGKKLTTTTFTVDGPNPFCKPCYMKLLSKPVLATDDTILAGGIDRSAGNESAGASSVPARRPSYNKQSSSTMSNPLVGITKLQCPKCSKSVYKAEEITLAGFSWHKNCFTCGGRNDDDGCRRKLTQNDVHPHRGNPFCKLCIGKQPILDKKKDSFITRNDTEMSSTSEDISAPDNNAAKLAPSHSASTDYGNGRYKASEVPVKKVIVVPTGKEPSSASAASASSYAAPVQASAAATTAPTSAVASVVPVDKSGLNEDLSPGDAENKELDDDELHTIYQDENGVPCTKDGEPLPPDTPKTHNSDCLTSEMSATAKGESS